MTEVQKADTIGAFKGPRPLQALRLQASVLGLWGVISAATCFIADGSGIASAAQPTAHGPGQEHAESEETEPVQCWWRTSIGAVRVGEPFSVVLTCALVEAQSTSVVADEGKLDPTVIDLPPFEVLTGRRGTDLQAPDRRFIQYEYNLRLVSDSLFDTDVPLPPLKITYRVKTRGGEGGMTEGLERTYVLPQQSIHLLSLVSDDASDIRDAPSTTFAEVEAAAIRATTLVRAGGVLMALGGLVAIVGLGRAASGLRSKVSAADQPLSGRAILRRVDRELGAVMRAREDGGWTPELAGRALAALRIAANYATARRVSQQTVDAETDAADGALIVHAGLRGRRVLVSGSVTPWIIAHDLTRARTAKRGGADRGRLEEIQTILTGLTHAAYGRDAHASEADLDAWLAAGRRLVRQLARKHHWIVKKLAAMTKNTTDLGRRVWSR